MNVVQLHERVRFWLDITGTARFENVDLDNAINAAMTMIIENKYMASRANRTGDSFQRTQKVRDELSRLVKVSDSSVTGSITINGSSGSSLIPIASFPSDYKYLLCVAVYDPESNKLNCWPTTYDEIYVLPRNPYRRPRSTVFPKQYFIESDLGISVLHNFNSLTRAEMYYLAIPIKWNYGIEVISGDAIDDNTKLIVTSETLVYASTTYLRGDELTIAAPNLVLTSGTAIKSFVNSDINENLHESIAQSAAINALISIGDSEKVNLLINSMLKLYV